MGFKEFLEVIGRPKGSRVEKETYRISGDFPLLPEMPKVSRTGGELVFEQVLGVIRLLEEKKPDFERLDGWWPSYLNEPETILPVLFARFIELRERFSDPEPIFLDCGCGDGVIMVLAGRAGFRSFGIEINQSLATVAQEINTQAFQEGLTTVKGKVALGSYYLSQFSDKLRPKATSLLRYYFNKYGRIHTDSFDEYTSSLLFFNGFSSGMTGEERVARVLGETEFNPYEQLGLLKDDQGGLKLLADLVYCYSSDLFFEDLFFEQFRSLSTEKDFLLAIFSPDGERYGKGFLKRGEFLPMPLKDFPQMGLNVLKKDWL